MIPAYRILAVLAVWVASMLAVGYWQRNDGAARCEAAWQDRSRQEASIAATRTQALQNAARQQEQQSATAMAAISADYETRIHDAQTLHDRDVAAARSGALRLRYVYPAPALPAGGNPIAETGAGTSGRNGSSGGELPGEIAAGLYGLADDADAIARQLAACQAVVRQDRAP